MKVTTWVDLGSQEIDVQVTGEEMVSSLIGDEDGWTEKQLLTRAANNVSSFLNKLPDSVIEEVEVGSLKLITEYTEKLAARFRKIYEVKSASL